MMPVQNGYELTKEIKKQMRVPIILLTAKGEVENRIKGLELGADDYIGKPFEPKELLLRVRNIINKNNKINLKSKHSVGTAEVDLNKMTVSLNNKAKKINNSEKKVLIEMIANPGTTYSREEIGKISGINQERSIDVMITRLRQKLEKNAKQPQFVKTIRGKGYKLICVTTDKQSKEKIDILRAVGAEVIICPTNVEPDDPRSYYSVAKKIGDETPNSWYVNQYDNLSNSKAHYLSTGPEIWDQTNGKITHFVVGVGTGGTISGVGKFLKEKNPNIKVWGIDTYGSVFKKYHETGVFDKNEIYPYITEGIGEDILPKNVDFDIIDYFEKVTDQNAATYTRRLAKEEGIFAGNSCGAAVRGVVQLKKYFKKDDVVVVLLHDSGSRYVGKFYNDDWMKKNGFKLD